MVPNNGVLSAVIVPLVEPDSVDVKVRLGSGVRPSQVQALLDDQIDIPVRAPAAVLLEELDGDDLVVRIQATPERANDGARLADQIIAALASVTREHSVTPPAPDADGRDDGERSPARQPDDATEARRPDGAGEEPQAAAASGRTWRTGS